MTTYRADSPDNINEIFSREGDALQRAGFRYPDMTGTPDGFERYDTNTGSGDSTVDTQLSPIQEAAKLVIDVETYLEG